MLLKKFPRVIPKIRFQQLSNRVILVLMATNKLSPEIVNAAIEGFEQQKLRIDVQIGELRAMLDGDRPAPAATPDAAPPKRRISAAARRRMALGQRKRWAASKIKSATVAAKPKRKLSAAGRANIVAALKKRWAAKKAGLTVVRKAGAKRAAPSRVAAKRPAKTMAAA